MDLSYEDVLNILKIIDSSSLEELHLELGDFKLVVKKKGTGSSPLAPDRSGSSERSAMAQLAEPMPVSRADSAASLVAQGAKETAVARAKAPTRLAQKRGHEVKAPMVGTFYRASAPGAPPFVDVGSLVAEDDTVCIIEVMKLMNSIRAGCRGRVVEICAENGALIEFSQTLMVIEPLP